MKKKGIILIVIVVLFMLFPIPMRLKDGGSVEYRAILYKYTKVHKLSEESATGYIDGWELSVLGKRVGGVTNVYVSTEKLKLNLFNRKDIIKVSVDNYSQYNNYIEYTDNDTIDVIYNLFKDLETNVRSNLYEPDNPDELYKITFYNNDNMLVDSDNDIFKAIVYVYKKDHKYYAFEAKNGIYEITLDSFNIVKGYAKY